MFHVAGRVVSPASRMSQTSSERRELSRGARCRAGAVGSSGDEGERLGKRSGETAREGRGVVGVGGVLFDYFSVVISFVKLLD